MESSPRLTTWASTRLKMDLIHAYNAHYARNELSPDDEKTMRRKSGSTESFSSVVTKIGEIGVVDDTDRWIKSMLAQSLRLLDSPSPSMCIPRIKTKIIHYYQEYLKQKESNAPLPE